MYPIKRQVLRCSIFLIASTLLIGCAGQLKQVYVHKTLPTQEKIVKATIVKNYDTVQSRSLLYKLTSCPEGELALEEAGVLPADDQAITSVGSNDRTYSFEVPGSDALQPGEALCYKWAITFNRGGIKSMQRSFVVPGMPDLIIPPVNAFEFRVNNQLLPGNPGAFNPDQHPSVQVNQRFTALVKVRNIHSTVMSESFVVQVNVYNSQTNNFETLETRMSGIPQGQEVLAPVTFQSDSPTTLIFSARVDDGDEIPETNEENNDSGFAQYKIRVVE